MGNVFEAPEFAVNEIDLVRSFVDVRNRCGKGFVRQALEMWRLGRGRGQISSREYFYYQLYDDAAFTEDQKKEFVGQSFQRQLAHLSEVAWFAACHDKLLYHLLLRGLELPTPVVSGVVDSRRCFPGAASLRDVNELRSFVSDSANFPFFCKPIGGMFSRGVAEFVSFDSSNETLQPRDHDPVALEQVDRVFRDPGAGGYLIQPVVRPHSDLAKLSPRALCTVRMLWLVEQDRMSLYRALLKIPTGTNAADNFWRLGNVLAAVDADSGRIVRAVQNDGGKVREIERHPDTDVALVGFELPGWKDAVSICQRAAQQFAGIRIQAWDVALTEQGPSLVEVNIGGDVNLPQLAFGRGLLDDTFEAFLVRADQSPTRS